MTATSDILFIHNHNERKRARHDIGLRRERFAGAPLFKSRQSEDEVVFFFAIICCVGQLLLQEVLHTMFENCILCNLHFWAVDLLESFQGVY